MATSSIFKNIVIKDKEGAEKFFAAMEYAEKNPYTPPENVNVQSREMTEQDIENFWENWSNK